MRKSIVKFEDVKDQVFNYLKVIEEDVPYFNGKYNQRRWIFECICGNKKSLLPSNVLNGSVKSCGCLKHEITKEKIQNHYNKKYEFPVELRSFSNYKRHLIIKYKTVIIRCFLKSSSIITGYGITKLHHSIRNKIHQERCT